MKKRGCSAGFKLADTARWEKGGEKREVAREGSPEKNERVRQGFSSRWLRVRGGGGGEKYQGGKT